MENSSKALIIAGSVLISILLVSTGVYVYDASKGDAVDKSAEASGKILAQATLEGETQEGEGNIDNPLAPELVLAETGDIVTDPEGREWYVLQNNSSEVKLILKDYQDAERLNINHLDGARANWYNYTVMIDEKLNELYTQPEWAQEIRNPQISDLEEVVGVNYLNDRITMEFTHSERYNREHTFIKDDRVTGAYVNENNVPVTVHPMEMDDIYVPIIAEIDDINIGSYYEAVESLNMKIKETLGTQEQLENGGTIMYYLQDKLIKGTDTERKAEFAIGLGIYDGHIWDKTLCYSIGGTDITNSVNAFIRPITVLDSNYELAVDLNKTTETVEWVTGVGGEIQTYQVNYFRIEPK